MTYIDDIINLLKNFDKTLLLVIRDMKLAILHIIQDYYD